MLLDWGASAGDVDMVIGRKEGDQPEDEATNCLGQTEPVEAGQGTLQLW